MNSFKRQELECELRHEAESERQYFRNQAKEEAYYNSIAVDGKFIHKSGKLYEFYFAYGYRNYREVNPQPKDLSPWKNNSCS